MLKQGFLFITFLLTLTSFHFFNESPSRLPQSHDEDPNNIQTLCSLPAEMVNADYYAKYCGNGSCLATGINCDEHSECCSRMCNNGLCATDQNNRLGIGQICQERTDCETNICENHPTKNFKICYGTNQPGLCSLNGELCKDRTNCCSNKCIANRCVGSPHFPSRTGEFCLMDHNECFPSTCNIERNRCR